MTHLCYEPHLPAKYDAIGDMTLYHGERDEEQYLGETAPCLCGHPDYLTCPEYGDGIYGMTVEISKTGKIRLTRNKEGVTQ